MSVIEALGVHPESLSYQALCEYTGQTMDQVKIEIDNLYKDGKIILSMTICKDGSPVMVRTK